MKKYFKDFYGSTASISKVKDGFRLKVCNPYGICHLNKVYTTEQNARRSMGRLSECWREVLS